MKLLDIFRLAFGNLRRNRLRTVLTVSGVVVGIGAIVFLVSLGYGLKNLATKKVANLDALTLLTVNPGNKEETKLKGETVEKFKKLDDIEKISPIKTFPTQITLKEPIGTEKELSSDAVLYAIDSGTIDLEEDAKVKWGRTINNSSNEIVVSQAVLKTLNAESPESLLEKELNIRAIQLDENGNVKNSEGVLYTLKLVGITAEEKTKNAFAPLPIFKELYGDSYKLIRIKVSKRNALSDTRKAIESMGYPTVSIKDTVDQIDRAFVIINSVLGGFGFIALFVAAIGIFNTMTISLLERTHEIGIMKAIGGRDKDIARVFTTEASIIGLLGGTLGVFAGWFLGFALNNIANMVAASVRGETNNFFYIPPTFIVIIIIFAFSVSTLAGVLPAKRAARLDPLDALRYE